MSDQNNDIISENKPLFPERIINSNLLLFIICEQFGIILIQHH